MAAPHEVFSFVNKFLNLSGNGESANLSLQCDHGKVTINLQLHLEQCPPPPYYPHPPPRPQPRPHHQPSPSRLRRTTRRAHARAQVEDEKVLKTEKFESSGTTEQVVAQPQYSTKKAENASLSDLKDLSEKVLQSEHELLNHETDLIEPAEQAAPTIDAVNNAIKENDDEMLQNNTDDERAKIMEIMEDIKNNFTLNLRQTVRQSVQEAFKPP